MKRTLSLITLVAICSAMMVSCKNTKSNEPTSEEIQAQKAALADSVLALIDNISNQYITLSDSGDFIYYTELSDEEKIVKPDYLLDLGEADNFINQNQKENALAIYYVEYFVRLVYDMPTDEAKEVIAKLAADVNYPSGIDVYSYDRTNSEVATDIYNAFKERGEVDVYWQYVNALLDETAYLLAKNPVFLEKASEEQYAALYKEFECLASAIQILAPYDEEMKLITDTNSTLSEEYWENMKEDFSSIETAKKVCESDKYNFIARRNALLQ